MLTQLAVGGPVWDNPWGHVSILINGTVFSYGTNYSGGPRGTLDWGGNAAAFLSTQSDLRTTELMTLNISAEQESKLLAALKANSPYSQPYDVLGHSCVGALINPLKQAGILSDEPGPIVYSPKGDLQAGAPSSITPNGLGNLLQGQGLVSGTTVVGHQPLNLFWRIVYGGIAGLTPE